MTRRPSSARSDGAASNARHLGQLLDLAADARGDEPAVTDGRGALTWAGYRERAAVLAGALAEHGVAPGDRVGVLLPKSLDSFVAVHAVVRAGAVMVPLDWFAPPSVLADVVADAEVDLIVTTAGDDVVDRLRAARPGLDTVAPDNAGDALAAVGREPGSDAYIVYTSGSTGRPKGIVHTHASALAYARAAVETYGLTAQDALVNVAPLHFDQSTFELWAAPLVAARVVVLSDAVLRFPASIAKLVEAERATVWYSVPYAVTQLVERGGLDGRDLRSLRWVLFGGESFPPGALRRAMLALPDARFSNVYGPAEVNQCTAFHLDAPPAAGDDTAVPIGAAWYAARLRVVDDGVDVSAPGASGELLVASATMMDRYWARDEATIAAVSVVDGERWYRTGDRVRRGTEDPELLTFLGRVDHQVKLRGHRIELESVELAVGEQPGVAECAVTVVRGDEDRLVAVVAPPEAAHDPAAVLAGVRALVPRYAVPAEVVGVSTVPRSGNGKIDRAAVARLLQAETPDPGDPAERNES